MHRSFQRLMACAAMALVATALPGVELPRNQLEAEQTYEIRLQRLLQAEGRQSLFNRLAEDMAQPTPAPHVKAWYANYLLYGQELGLGGVVDHKRGFELAKESEAAGSLFGLELLGRAWGDGRGPGYRDSMRALKLLQEAADRGRDTAMCELSTFYFFGRPGLARDPALAVQWARRAAWQGATIGLYRLAEWWGDPERNPEPDAVMASQLFYEAAVFGEGSARTMLAKRAKEGDVAASKFATTLFLVDAREGAVAYPAHVRAAIKWLDEHASPDEALVQLAMCELMINRERPGYDPKRAREKLTYLADKGNDDARALLALMAWHGIGQRADKAEAVATWSALAARKNAVALNFYGWLHWWGNGVKQGVPKDARKAFELCRESADLGYFMGQINLADCYLHGIGTEQNYHLAAKYYDTLSHRGFIRGRDMRARALAHVKD